MIYVDPGLGASPSAAAPLVAAVNPVAGVVTAVVTSLFPSAAQRTENGIQGRIPTFSTWTNEHLYRAMTLGGEDKEAALRVLTSRGMPPSPPQVIVDWWNGGSKGTPPSGTETVPVALPTGPAQASPMSVTLGPPSGGSSLAAMPGWVLPGLILTVVASLLMARHK